MANSGNLDIWISNYYHESMNTLHDKVWWNYIEQDLRELLKISYHLLAVAKTWDESIHDYSFVVFPAAKAYEGFLKKLFLDLEFISEGEFNGKRFRIGKALNPNLEEKYRKKISVYDKISNYCGGSKLADQLWDTWKNSRNLLFHWFPNEKNAISLERAEECLGMVTNSIDAAYGHCEIDLVKSKINNA